MSKRDCYEVLGIQRTATIAEIKKSYRGLAVQFHPDKNPGDKASEEKFKEATEAYSILSNAEDRAKYDQFGHAAFAQGAGQNHGDFSGFEDIFGDIFSAFFGGDPRARAGGRGRAGNDLRYDLKISFLEAVNGIDKEIKIGRRVKCEDCEGTGAAAGNKPETCPQCRGGGQIRVQQGFFTIQRTCNVCAGSGKFIKNACKKCSGSGLTVSQTKLNVKVPPGIDNGQRLKLRGEGEPGSGGGPSGDLYVQIAIEAHALFERDGSELYCAVPIGYSDAVLGGEVSIPTLEGEAKLKIPAGTESGKIIKLKNRGIPILGSTRRGDLHVQVNIHVPKKVSDGYRTAVESLKSLESESIAHDHKGLFDKVKQMFG